MSDDLVDRLEHLARKMASHGQYDDWSRVVSEALDEIKRLRAALDETQLRSIEASNPDIDMDDVRRIRASGAT